MSLVFADDSELFDLPVLEPSDRGQEVSGVGQAVSPYRKLTHDIHREVFILNQIMSRHCDCGIFDLLYSALLLMKGNQLEATC